MFITEYNNFFNHVYLSLVPNKLGFIISNVYENTDITYKVCDSNFLAEEGYLSNFGLSDHEHCTAHNVCLSSASLPAHLADKDLCMVFQFIYSLHTYVRVFRPATDSHTLS